MTIYDFIYRIGYGVALIILFFIFADTNEKLPQEKRQSVLLILAVLHCSLFYRGLFQLFGYFIII